MLGKYWILNEEGMIVQAKLHCWICSKPLEVVEYDLGSHTDCEQAYEDHIVDSKLKLEERID
jgi:hypothetical protein